MVFNEGDYLTSKLIFHKALNLFYFDCEITLESVPVYRVIVVTYIVTKFDPGSLQSMAVLRVLTR